MAARASPSSLRVFDPNQHIYQTLSVQACLCPYHLRNGSVVYPSNKRFSDDIENLLKLSSEHLIDFLIVTSSGYPIAWKLAGKITQPANDISWVLNLEISNKSNCLKTVREFTKQFFPHLKDPPFISFQAYFDKQFEKKTELIVPDFDLINKELVKYLTKHPECLHELHWRRFEELLCLLFKNMGYETTLGPGRGDMGVDLRLIEKNNVGQLLILVQAKKYAPENRISLEPVQALYGAVNKEEANKGILVSTSEFEPVAKRFATSTPYRIELAGPNTILDWLKSF